MPNIWPVLLRVTRHHYQSNKHHNHSSFFVWFLSVLLHLIIIIIIILFFIFFFFFFSSIYGWIYGWMEPVGEEWLQQLKRVFCLLGKLQVTIPVISIAAKHQGRSGKMWCLWVDQSQLWYRLLQLCIYISGEMHVRIRYSYGGVQAPT